MNRPTVFPESVIGGRQGKTVKNETHKDGVAKKPEGLDRERLTYSSTLCNAHGISMDLPCRLDLRVEDLP